jgi:hypothetical protein
VCCQRSLRRIDHSSRGVLPTVARRCVWSRNLQNEEAKARYRAVKIQPQWVVTPGKWTNKILSRKACDEKHCKSEGFRHWDRLISTTGKVWKRIRERAVQNELAGRLLHTAALEEAYQYATALISNPLDHSLTKIHNKYLPTYKHELYCSPSTERPKRVRNSAHTNKCTLRYNEPYSCKRYKNLSLLRKLRWLLSLCNMWQAAFWMPLFYRHLSGR